MRSPRGPWRRASLLGWAGLLAAARLAAAQLPVAEGYAAVAGLMSGRAGERRAAAAKLVEAGEARWVPPIVDGLFFIPTAARGEALGVLRALTGAGRDQAGERYYDWVELVGRRGDVAPPPRYLEWKRSLLARIDPEYRALLHDGAPQRLRLEEVVWGGVRLDGIPSLDEPAAVAAGEARYPDDEKVFGVAAGGAQRAYPLRILSWHEMLNDRVGGEPIVLSYCTLCGSGVVYSARVAGEARAFGTSGLLYRSNKLMFDRESRTLWSNLTGEALFGPLAAGPERLALLPVVVTTWGEWRRRHPDTTVLRLDREAGRRLGFDYRPGAADRARAGVAFPVWQRSRALDAKEEVLGVRHGEAAKAYPVAAVLRQGVVNDEVGGEPVVVVGDPASGALRVYLRGARRLRPGTRPEELRDEAGDVWTATEEALQPPPESDAPPLPRLPAHHAFWFGWYAFFPHTEVFDEGG